MDKKEQNKPNKLAPKLFRISLIIWIATCVVFVGFILLYNNLSKLPNGMYDLKKDTLSLITLLFITNIALGTIAFLVMIVTGLLKGKGERKVKKVWDADTGVKFAKPDWLKPTLITAVIILSLLVVGQATGTIRYAEFEASTSQVQGKVVSPENLVIPTSQPQTPAPAIQQAPIPTAKVNANPVITTSKQPLPVLSGSEIFNAINAYRALKGKTGLSVSDELCRIAEGRADFMMIDKMAAFKSSGLGNHTGFRDTFDYSGAGIGENLAANVVSTTNVMALWKSSPPHNELMLATEWNGTPLIKGCIATRVKDYGSVVVLEVGDK